MSQLLPRLKIFMNNGNFILMIAALIYVIVQYLITQYIRKLKYLYILYMLASVSFIMIDHKSIIIFTSIVSFSCLKSLMSLDEMKMLESDGYGILRAYAAFGMAVGAIVAGWLNKAYKLYYIVIYIVVGIIVYLLIKNDEVKSRKNDQYCFNKNYIIYLIIFFLLYSITSLDQYLVIEKLIAMNASGQQIALKWSIQALCEIPALFLLDRLLKNYTLNQYLMIAIGMYSFKFFIYGFANDINTILIGASLQLLTLPLLNYVSKFIIKKYSYGSLKNQLFASIFFQGLSLAVAPLLSLLFINYINLSLFLCSLFILMIGFIVMYLQRKNNI